MHARRVHHPAMAAWRKEPCPPGPQTGVKCPEQLAIKTEYEGQVFQIDLVKEQLVNYSLQALKSKIQEAFNISAFKVDYTNEKGDQISVNSEGEFKEALRVGLEMGTLCFTVTKMTPEEARQPRRVHHPTMVTWRKEPCPPGPQSGVKCPEQLVIKTEYKGQVIQMDLVKEQLVNYSLQALKSKVQTTFNISGAFKVDYVDEEGDRISVDSEGEFREALRVGQKLGTLHFNISKKEVHSPYVDDLHWKLSTMRVSSDSAPSSHAPDEVVPMEIKYPPTHQHHHRHHQSKRPRGHYAELALAVGEEQRKQKKIPGPIPHPHHQKHMESFESFLKTSFKGEEQETLPKPCLSANLQESFEAYVKQSGTSSGPRPFSPELEPTRKYVESFESSLKCATAAAEGVSPPPLPKRARHGTRGGGKPVCIAVGGKGGVRPLHDNIICDGCQNFVVGVRYKCGNCVDYDLCEMCEPNSQHIHPEDHVFLKMKVPAKVPFSTEPLLKTNLYKMEHHGTTEECRPRHHRHRSHTHSGGGDGGSGYITRTREEIREDIKQRRRHEKKKQYLEEKLSKVNAKLEACTLEDKPTHQRGHGKKILGAEFDADVNYPDGSILPAQVPFEKSWLVSNSGTKKWKHVKLVHVGGVKPACGEVEVSEVRPGHTVELTVQYPAMEGTSGGQGQDIRSEWRLEHKGAFFGPHLWLSGVLQQPSPPKEATPPTAAALPVLPPAADPEVAVKSEELTNENLLKSIGFIPSTASVTNESTPLVEISDQDAMMASTDQLLQTFEMVENPGHAPLKMTSGPDDDDDDDDGQDMIESDDFVMVVPDCFDLDKPLSDFAPPASSLSGFPFTSPQDSLFLSSVPPACEGTPEMSCDSHVTTQSYPAVIISSMPLPPGEDAHSSPVVIVSSMPDAACDSHMTARSTPAVISSFPPPPPQEDDGQVVTAQPAATSPSLPTTGTGNPPPLPAEDKDALDLDCNCDDSDGDDTSSPSTARRISGRPLTLRQLKDGLYRNPLGVATGLVNAVSGFMENKVHFAPSQQQQQQQEKRPVIKFSEISSSDESDEEFEDARAPLDEADHTPSAPPIQPWKTQQGDIKQIMDGDKDISHLLSQRWDGPHMPSNPMDRLIAMGFADRTLNAQLLEKHQGVLQNVLEELLDKQNDNFV